MFEWQKAQLKEITEVIHASTMEIFLMLHNHNLSSRRLILIQKALEECNRRILTILQVETVDKLEINESKLMKGK